jgi:hypothetical protein
VTSVIIGLGLEAGQINIQRRCRRAFLFWAKRVNWTDYFSWI